MGWLMGYLLVAAGGAVGSMLRYGLGNLGVALLGGSFPWATVGINVAGSALIGFVASATLPGGMLPNSPALRTLVMVGVCGGFTTFSSFSLQTLDLIREARPGAALANVGLSVLLCVAGTAAGSYGATGPAQRRASHAADAALHRGTVALAVLDRVEAARPVLDASRGLLAASGGGSIRAIAVAPPGERDVAPTEEVVPSPDDPAGADRLGALRRAYESSFGAGEAAAREDRAATPARIELGWTTVRGIASAVVAEQGSRSDVVVIGRAGETGDTGEGRRHAELHAALFATHRPVLVVPPGAERAIGRVVAIAWDGHRAVRSAVTTAMPLLRAASRVVVLTEAGLARVPQVLADGGIRAELVRLAGDGPLGGRILDAARAAEADLLIMGAYRHWPSSEQLFGGVTLDLLEHSEVPLLMRH